MVDWGDSHIGNPVLDLAVLGRLEPASRNVRTANWLAAWARAVPGSDPARAWALGQPLAVLREACGYQMFLDNIEPAERIYHEGDIEPALRRASDLVATERR